MDKVSLLKLLLVFGIAITPLMISVGISVSRDSDNSGYGFKVVGGASQGQFNEKQIEAFRHIK